MNERLMLFAFLGLVTLSNLSAIVRLVVAAVHAFTWYLRSRRSQRSQGGH